jgi:hypothetical protein
MSDTLMTRRPRRRQPLRAEPIAVDDVLDLRDESEPTFVPWLRPEAFEPPYA